MTNEDFETFVEKAWAICKLTMEQKEMEYAQNDSRFHNFIRAGIIMDESKEKAWRGIYMKHLVSVLDMVEAIDRGELVENYEEKLKDSIVYHFLLWGMLEERKNGVM